MSPANRHAVLITKGFCVQCLFPGANASTGKHKEGKCQRDFSCPHPSHQNFPRKHVLVCQDHKDTTANKNLLETYKSRYMKNPNLPSFAKNISLSFHSRSFQSTSQNQSATSTEKGIYLLQKIVINQKVFTIFYDNGCSNFLVQHDAIKMMGSHAKKESSQITHIGGVGNTLTHNPWDVQCQHPDDQRTGRFTHRNLHGPNHLNFSTIPIDRSVQGDMPIVRR